ncbi:unnamed protein product [Symbiodinium necroappetens]|uniref:Uncharacterized protein n=1 Tax=Symbiodinium necroappetens TaxID=1628268 RepID=A0A813CLY2_9DINO|nr:unnamed protein product [Symbiodinium necroappetens]
MASRLRQNLTDPAIRQAVRQRCSSVPLETTDRSSRESRSNARPKATESAIVQSSAAGFGSRNTSRDRGPGGPGALTSRPTSRERTGGSAPGDSQRTVRRPGTGALQKSSSTGALSSSSSAAASRQRSSRRPVAKAQAVVNAEPIPIRGRRGADDSRKVNAQAALAKAVASLLGNGSSSSAVAAAVQAAADAGGAMQDELLKVSKKLDQLEREKQQLAESGLNVLARCRSQSRTRLASSPKDTTQAPEGKEGPSPSGPEAGADMDKHPWLLADGRLVTAHLQGENLALKRAVMKARREIDELLKGRAETEARARALKEENSAAAEALRRYTNAWMPQARKVALSAAQQHSYAQLTGPAAKQEAPRSPALSGVSGGAKLSTPPEITGPGEKLRCLLPPLTSPLSGSCSRSAPRFRPAEAQDELLESPSEERRLLFLDVDGVLHPLQVRMLEQTQKVDTSHCFQDTCMRELRRVVSTTGAQIILSSSWRKFEKTRQMLLEELAKHGLSFREWTTVAGGEGSDARVDQILAFVTASNVDSWAAVDDEDLAPSSSLQSEGMMKSLFRQHFVRTDASRGLDAETADALIQLLSVDNRGLTGPRPVPVAQFGRAGPGRGETETVNLTAQAPLSDEARSKLLQTSDEISRRMEVRWQALGWS